MVLQAHPEITVKCVLADALYGSDEFMSGASNIFGGIQVISQLRSNQNIRYRGKKKTILVFTVGSLQRRAQMDALMEWIESLLQQHNPGEKLKEMGQVIKDVFRFMPSGKHMSGKAMGRLEPTPSLSAKYGQC